MKRIKEEHTVTKQEVASFKEPVRKIVSRNDELGVTTTYHIECPHQFFKIADEIKNKEENMTRVPIRWGVKVMCVLCGQQRILWTDGEVEILAK